MIKRGHLHTLIAALAAAICLTQAATANTVKDFTRIRGQGESVLQGLGLVVGLNGTGDSGSELVMARPLANLLQRYGNPIPDFEELRSSRSVALVMITCVVPRSGAEVDDGLDIRISVINSATSLEGGELLASPLTNAVPGGLVYAFAQGPVSIEDIERPTTAQIRGGARFVRPVRTMPPIAGGFELVIDPLFASWSAANHIAQSINDAYFLTTAPDADPIALAIDPRSVRVAVPEDERPGLAAFVADILDTNITPSLLGVPAMVVCNSRTGVIVVAGDVQISPAIITHKDLVITTTSPAPVPTPEAPLTQQERWISLETNALEPELARIDDLLTAFDQLDVPPNDQIHILTLLHDAGKLHAKLVIDGVGR